MKWLIAKSPQMVFSMVAMRLAVGENLLSVIRCKNSTPVSRIPLSSLFAEYVPFSLIGSCR